MSEIPVIVSALPMNAASSPLVLPNVGMFPYYTIVLQKKRKYRELLAGKNLAAILLTCLHFSSSYMVNEVRSDVMISLYGK